MWKELPLKKQLHFTAVLFTNLQVQYHFKSMVLYSFKLLIKLV